MGKLTQLTLLSMLKTMVQDDDFVESLVDCIKKIFDIAPPNLDTTDPFELVVNRIMKYFEIQTEMQEVEIPGIRSTLIGMFKEKQFLAFARVLRTLGYLFEYPDVRICNYLKHLKFRTEMDGDSISPWIDVESTAEAVIKELNPERMRIFAELSREEKCLLQGFTSEQISVMSKFSPREIVALSKQEGIQDLTVEELSRREMDTLNNINDEYRNVVLSFRNLNEVLNVVKNLHPSQRNLILSLREEEFDAFLGNKYEEDLEQIQLILRNRPVIIQRFSQFSVAEQDAILGLTQQQRSVLGKAYDLGHDGLFMIRRLGPELTSQVLSGKKHSNLMQTALRKKLVNVDFDERILPQLFEIMDNGAQGILLDLSWKGIQLLRRTADLNEQMIDIVRRLSDDGMKVLMNNDQLTGTGISMLGNLDRSEGNVLINLNLVQRHYLSDRPDFIKPLPGLFKPDQLAKLRTLSNEATSVLQHILLLSDDEHLLFEGLQQLDTNILSILLPGELNFLASLTSEKLDLLSTFLFWRLGEDVTFEFSRIPRGGSFEGKLMQIRRILGELPEPGSRVDRHFYIPLIAGAIEVLRLDLVVTDNHVEEIIPMLGGPTFALLFKVNLLKFSVRDSTSLVPQLTARIEGTEADMEIVAHFNLINTIEDLMFIRWILSSSSTTNERGLFTICRNSLIHLSYHLDDGQKLRALLSASTFRNFKHMLEADQHLLSSFLFFAETAVQVTKILLENFDANECFQFLNTPASNRFLDRIRDNGLPDILSDARFPNPTILAVCLYHDRGNVLALTERLDEDQLWRLLENRPLLLFRLMTRNFRIDLIKSFGKVGKVAEVWKENHVEVFQSLIGELAQSVDDLTPEQYFHMARGIRKLAYWPQFLGTETYVTTISEYIELVQERMSKTALRDMLDCFVSRDVSREFLISAVEHQLGISLRDRSRLCCNIARKKREAGALCVDSENTRDLTSEAKQRIAQSTFDDTQSRLYDELLHCSERKFRGEDLDPQVQRDLMTRDKDTTLDPRIGDIDPEKFDTTLKQSGMLDKIEKVAGTTGSIFTLFFVGKHIVHGDIGALGYDALNLLILPKIGGRITEALEGSNPVIGSVLGTTVSNFAAFLGLVDGIIARKNAVGEVDKEIANLNIATNAVFIAVNIPAVAMRILDGFGVEMVVLGEFSGPVGVALTVSVVVVPYLIGVGLEVEKVRDHIQLSFWEKLSLYWEFFRDHPVPEKFVIDVLAKDMYTEYLANQLRRLNGSYDKIALSLPSFLITERDGNASAEMDFNHIVKALYPFSREHQHSRIVPENIQGYDFVCGPSTRDAIEKVIPQTRIKELSMPSKPDDECQNIVSFRKQDSLDPPKTFFYVASDAAIELSNTESLDIVFHGKNISIRDGGITEPYISVNRYYFQYQPDQCRIHKRGYNFFYVVGGSFVCDLGEQHNTVVIRSDFSDSSGIHSIVGSEGRERITANFAEFVDGSGGGDFIRATRNTIVKGYVNDLVTGDCTVMLPFNISGIAKLVAHTHIIISNQNGSWIEVDGNARIITADDYLLTPIRISNITHRMVRAHIRKTVKHQISIGQELPVLRNLTIPNCKLVKQITSVNRDIVLSDLGQNVFSMDKNGQEYYWEAAQHPASLYIFRRMFVKVTISNANGILDFRELRIDSGFNKVNYHWSLESGIKIRVVGLQVNLLPGFGKVSLTFDGEKYFKLGTSGMCRDWCSHSLVIVGRVLIDGNDLHNYYNCFEFNSDKILFYRLEDDLLLVSGKQALTISKYYSHLHGGTELSLKLRHGRIIEAPEFKARADHAHKVIYYEVENSELQIYHNQPVDKHHIGYLDLPHKSIKDIEMTIDDGRLLLLYRNSTLVRIENWVNYAPTRDMVFIFKDRILPNVECILSDCDPEDIIDEFKMEKRKRSATSSATRASSWINVVINPIRNYYATLFLPGPIPNRTPNEFSTYLCSISNLNLVLVLLQSFLDRISPRPKLRTITTVETLANVIDLIEEYSPRPNHDSFQMYSDIVELVRNERYDSVQKILNQLED